MNEDQLARAKEAFDAVATLPPGERARVLDDRCGEDAEVRSFVERMLAKHDAGHGDFLEPPAAPGSESESTTIVHRAEERFGRYVIENKIGEGGMGAVWKAHDTVLERAVALKFLPPSRGADALAYERFLREARIASSLDHPGIATVYDAGDIEGEAYVAMQFVDGTTVRDAIHESPPDVRETLRIVSEAAGALAFAHQKGVLHRDVTSRNIMIARDDRVLVVDFGLAFLEGQTRLTQTGATVGTVSYIAPEIIRGRVGDARSDLYSLGVVFYELLTGSVPFGGSRMEAVLYAAVNDPPVPPSERCAGLPEEVERICLRLLEKDPARRFEDASALRDAIDRVRGALDPSSVQLAPSIDRPSGSRVGRTAKGPWLRDRRILASTAIVLLAAALYAVWPPGRRGPEPTATPEVTSLAVLPFRLVDPTSREARVLQAGIGETLATKLTQVAGLRVTPWVTSRRYSEDSLSMNALFGELGVEAILLGSLSVTGGHIQGNVSLVDREGFQVWAMDYREPLEELFTVQRKIAVGLARHVRGELAGTELESLSGASSADVGAYRLYLDGAYAMSSGDATERERASSLFHKALDLDPGLAEAHVGLGAVSSDRYFRGGHGGGRNLLQARLHYARALEIDARNHAARRGLIRVHWQRGETQEILKIGREVEEYGGADAQDLLVRGDAFLFAGFPERSLVQYQQVLELDPANAGALWHFVVATAFAGRYEDATKLGEVYARRFGEDPELLTWMGVSYDRQGRTQKAEEAFERAIELFGDDSNLYVYYYYADMLERDGRGDWAAEVLAEGGAVVRTRAEAYPDNPRVLGMLAHYEALFGDREGYDEVKEWLLTHDSDNALTLFELGRSALAMNRPEEGFRLFDRAIDLGYYIPDYRVALTASTRDVELPKELRARVDSLETRLSALF